MARRSTFKFMRVWKSGIEQAMAELSRSTRFGHYSTGKVPIRARRGRVSCTEVFYRCTAPDAARFVLYGLPLLSTESEVGNLISTIWEI